ncbi:hypothetical protein JKP88DRAFT_249806 [Tribonema minus]|uniref:Uncharacterized protein n=1 Tax=Tribonema minus TaxID=303371 RepID=A0A835YJZ7_9STRA|nr:hypothetical protein JKP88DRAFT_249806 [Tribonema minus]
MVTDVILRQNGVVNDLTDEWEAALLRRWTVVQQAPVDWPHRQRAFEDMDAWVVHLAQVKGYLKWKLPHWDDLMHKFSTDPDQPFRTALQRPDRSAFSQLVMAEHFHRQCGHPLPIDWDCNVKCAAPHRAFTRTGLEHDPFDVPDVVPGLSPVGWRINQAHADSQTDLHLRAKQGQYAGVIAPIAGEPEHESLQGSLLQQHSPSLQQPASMAQADAQTQFPGPPTQWTTKSYYLKYCVHHQHGPPQRLARVLHYQTEYNTAA